MFISAIEPVTTPLPPTKEAIEQEKQRQMELVADLRRMLRGSQALHISALPRGTN